MKQTQLYHKYKATYYSAIMDLFTNLSLLGMNFVILFFLRNTIVSYFLTISLSLMLVRTFIVLHDCLHNSYTPGPLLNYCIAQILSILTLTSYRI